MVCYVEKLSLRARIIGEGLFEKSPSPMPSAKTFMRIGVGGS